MFAVIAVVLNQFLRQFRHQIAFHLADDRGRNEARLREFQFQIYWVEGCVAPLQGLFADGFGGLFGVVGGDFVSFQLTVDS